MDTVVVRFEEEPGEETEMRVSGVPLRELFDIQEMQVRWTREAFRGLCDRLAVFLVRWTYPEPATADGLLSRDPNWVLALRNAWITAIVELPLPLAARSSGGTRSPEEPTSQPSSTTPSSSTPSSDAIPATPSAAS